MATAGPPGRPPMLGCLIFDGFFNAELETDGLLAKYFLPPDWSDHLALPCHREAGRRRDGRCVSGEGSPAGHSNPLPALPTPWRDPDLSGFGVDGGGAQLDAEGHQPCAVAPRITSRVPIPLAAYRMPACHGRRTDCLPVLPRASTYARCDHRRRRNTHPIRAS